VKFVTSMDFSPPEQLVPLARACEEAGFDAVALSDHVVHPRQIETPYPYSADGAPRWQPFTPWPDPWVTIGALATATRRLRFVTGVFVLPARNVFQVAKTVGTAAVLSGGRVALGVGAGWMREEFELLEQPFARRGPRMDEMLEVLRKLWAGGFVEHHGPFYDFAPLEMSPVPPAPIPVYVGGLSEPALRRAATRADGWISDLHPTAELRERIAHLHALRADSPRAGEPFTVIAAATDAATIDGYRRLEEAGVTHLLTMPWVFTAGMTEDLERRLEAVRRCGEEVIAPMAGAPDPAAEAGA